MSDPVKKVRKIRFGCIGGLLFFLCFLMLGLGGVVIQTGYFLLFGWFGYFRRVVPQIEWNIASIAGGLTCLVAMLVCLHFLLRRFNPLWKWKWTAVGSALFLTLFAASIAVTGVVHQIVWLVREDSVQYRSQSYIRMRNLSDLRQMGFALKAWEADHDSFPLTLSELYPDYIDMDPADVGGFWRARGKNKVEREWLYFPEAFAIKDYPKGDSLAYPPVLIASPFGGGLRDVVHVDGEISSMLDEEFYEVIERQLGWLSDQQKSDPKP